MSQKKDKTKKRVVQKYNMSEVDDLWGTGLADDAAEAEDDLFGLDDFHDGGSASGAVLGDGQPFAAGDEPLAGDDLLYADSYSQDILADSFADDTGGGEVEAADDLVAEPFAEEAIEEVPAVEEAPPVAPESYEFSAQLEFIGGMRQEVARARLFAPEKNSILLTDPETNDELVVFVEQLTCLRISGLPPGITERQREAGVREVIETVDGASHHVLVCAKQKLDGFLCCFSPEGETAFPATLFPTASIKKRCQHKELTDILLEKRFISRSMLRRALQEFAQLKEMTFEKIIAQSARIPLAAIEEALATARQNQMLGMQTGEILLISGLVEEEQILEAIEYHEHLQHLQIAQFLIDKGFVNEVEVYTSLAEKHKIPFLDLRQRKIPKESLALLPKGMMAQHEILPLVRKDDALLVATHAVDMSPIHEAIVRASHCKDVKYVLSPPSQIRKIIHLL